MSPSLATSRPSKSSSRSRKVIITLVVLVLLVLVGTVLVLSSVSYCLALAPSAFLTEEEVPWRPEDRIRSLYEPPPAEVASSRRKRAEWDEISPADTTGSSSNSDPIMGTGTIAEVWEELEEEPEDDMEADEQGNGGYDDAIEDIGVGKASAESDPIDAPELDDDVDLEDHDPLGEGAAEGADKAQVDEGGWGVDGKGTGGYWMKANWDGTVRDTQSWQRLYNVTTRPGETMPRLIHQTWKTDMLPPKWQKAWRECREGMSDYEYFLWTDEVSREFVATHYPAYLQMYDSYKYPIQRADSIRYFILHHFGGIYMDLDIGCRRRLDPLLQGDWDVILPITKPVGVSNDLIFSSKGSAFIDGVVHGLPAFNHEWFINYPTVMFSTGPMYVSAQYSIYTSAHLTTGTHPRAEIRILPKSLYGKNAAPESVPHSFFSHFYGSSWHADDAGFISFLGTWGEGLMYVAGVALLLAALRLVLVKSGKVSGSGSDYQLLSTLPGSAVPTSIHSGMTTPTSDGQCPMSPPTLDAQDIASTLRRAGNLIPASPATLLSRTGRRKTGLF